MFENWNTDGDELSEEEFTAGFSDAGLFEDFAAAGGIENTDDGIAEDEFLGGLFDWFGADGDGGIIADETGWFG